MPRTTPTHILAKQFFTLHADKDFVKNTDLHAYISERNGQTSRVLNGTLDGTGPGSLISFDWYTSVWCKDKLENGRIIHRKHNATKLGALQQREMNYATEEKRLTMERIMSYVPTTGTPHVLTLASVSGNCVVAATSRNPKVSIDNIEMDQGVIGIWENRKRELGVQTQDFHCTLQDFVEAPGFGDKQYDVFNADVMGYASEGMYRYMKVLNATLNCRVIAVTTQCLDNFRNHGKFADSLRAKYVGQADKHAKCIADWLFNYTMVDRWTYRKAGGTRKMEVFIFQLEE